MVPSLFQNNVFVLPPSRYQNNTLRSYPTVNNPTTYPLNYILSPESNKRSINDLISILFYITLLNFTKKNIIYL